MASFTFLFYVSLRNLPRLILNTCIASIAIYLYFQDVDISTTLEHLQRRIRIPDSVQDAFFSCLENVNGELLQRIVICVLYVLPVGMEMLALLLLTRVNENVSISYCCILIILELGLLIPFHFDIALFPEHKDDNRSTSNKNMNEGPSLYRGRYRLFFGYMTFVKKSNTTLMDCRIHAWACLYAIALLIACFMMGTNRIHTPILLGGPFLLATGFFFILSTPRGDDDDDDDDTNLIMDVLRRVMRQTLADVMMEVGEDVAQDEMLRLAMLRWIVDYWAESNTKSEDRRDTSRNSGSSSSGSGTYSRRRREPATNTASQEEGPASASTFESSSHPPNRPAQTEGGNVTPEQQNPLGWSELSSMLSLTMEQMHSETNSSDNPHQSNHSNNDIPPSPSPNQHQNESVHNLQTMMMSFNVDERAKPAVDSYKSAVESIPPTRTIAITTALTRRCPALLSSVYVYLVVPHQAMQCTIMLLPLILLEYVRVLEWLAACHETTTLLRVRGGENDNNTGLVSSSSDQKVDVYGNLLPCDMDPMQILLSEDSYSTYNRGTALQVWNNIQSSIDALYSGLTAMKCAHTAQVATHVAFNVISLAKFAAEVRNDGLGIGVGLILMDLFDGRRRDGPYRSKISTAAVNIVEGGKVVSRNVSELVEEGKEGKNFLSPVISFFFGLGEHSDDDDKNGQDHEEDECSKKSSGEDSGKGDSFGDESNAKEDDDSNSNEGMDVNEKDATSHLPEVNAAENDTDGRDHIPTVPLNDLELDEVSCSPSIDTDDENAHDLNTVTIHDDNDDDDDDSWTDINAIPTEDEDMNEHSADGINTTEQSTSGGFHATVNAAISLTLAKRESSNEDNSGDRIQNVHRNSTASRGNRHEAVEPKSNDDTLKWLGAGAAILGTVIGGIALAGNKEDSSTERGSQGEDTRRRSNVVIERLDDE